MAVKSSNFPSKPEEWVKGKAIGTGAFGLIHIAMSKTTGKLFAVKSAQSDAGFQSLENEANILETLDSPYTVRYLGREVSKEANGEQKLKLFMEYMAGGNLSDVAEKFGGALDETVIRLYTREILQGLKYLHNSGIVHCDLKCKNLLLGPSVSIKLADFGCAKRMNASKTEGFLNDSWKSVRGTPLWMAPEVMRNEGVDYAADIWSLGCTVIEMATGRAPWVEEEANPMAAVLKIACGSDTPRLPTWFSEEGLDFLAKCLQREPAKRWTAEELLNHPFVSGNAQKSSDKEDARSPASILDVERNEEDYDSDELESPSSREEVSSRIPFSMRCHGEGKRVTVRQQIERDFLPSDNWVTVRSM